MAEKEKNKKVNEQEKITPAPIMSKEELDNANREAIEKPVESESPQNDTTTPPIEQKPVESSENDILKEWAKREGPAGDLARQQLGITNEKKYEDEIVKGYDDQIKDMDAFIGQMQSNVKKTEDQENEEAKAKKKMFASDLTEAAAAIANLIGTAKGATSQQWTSPHQTWVQRVDTLRKEREEKLNTYRTQLASLNQAKRQLQQSKASSALGYERLRSQESNNESRLQIQAEQLQQKIISADQSMALKLKSYDQKRAQAIYDDAMKRWSSYISSQTRQHNNPGTAESVMKQFLQQAIDFYDKVSPAAEGITDPRIIEALESHGFKQQ